MNDESKTNEELKEEIKKLREETEKQNKTTNQNSAFNSLIGIGAILLVVGAAIWLFVTCAF